jgi:Papain-like cysteine protease AvrRpt2
MNLLDRYPLPDVPQFDIQLGENETKLQVPGFRQLNGYACGAVSAYSVVKAFHPRVSYEKVYKDCNPSEEDGTGVPQLLRALRKNGVGVSVRWNLTFKSIVKTIEAGFPIIVGECQNGEGSDHWVVLYGYGLRPNRVFTCGQPNVVALSGREAFEWRDWLEIWDEKGLGLVCWGKP